jgi:hypothetical protein
MADRRAFKIDESFLEKISIGAMATKKVFEHLEKTGHRPIELERGSMSFKIWKKIKIKRVRVPDILCVNCGKRIESRGKTKLEITMSHSFSTQERGWDFGLNPEDYVAIVKCRRVGDRPIDWKAEEPIQYISVSSMKTAFKKGYAISEKPKGATEGFEARVTWPSSLASASGKVISLDEDKLQYQRKSDNRTVTLRLKKKKIKLKPIVKLNEVLSENQIIASVVPVSQIFECNKNANEKYYKKALKSASISDRYAAAKVLYLFPSKSTARILLARMNDTKEHIYIRLEAASSLLKMGYNEPVSFFHEILDDQYLENRLEVIIILGEIRNDIAFNLLTKTLLDANQHPEIRAGAAWSLGELKNKKALDALVRVFNEVEGSIRIEAARAVAKLGEKFSREIIEFIPDSNEKERAGLAWALSKSSKFKVQDLIPAMTDSESRKWVAWIVGTQNEAAYIDQIEQMRIRDKEVYFAVTVLWKILSSWIEGLDIY